MSGCGAPTSRDCDVLYAKKHNLFWSSLLNEFPSALLWEPKEISHSSWTLTLSYAPSSAGDAASASVSVSVSFSETRSFDPHFNAITGLNGSGKSNILDSICFVLGITNLSQVRAGNLHELVYKQGQAGVNKAVVTIVFDNSDPNGSPVGYESFAEVSVTRQVLIGGKSKYLINGHTAQASQVQNLFHSVQLNVNNPHFLIMQGRITKVLNMKPVEILGMVEEAAGTRLYESKKQTAMKTIEKKQLKVNELNSVLNEEITPTLERLRGEKQHYLKWSKNTADIKRIERFCVAYEFFSAQKTLSSSKTEVDQMQQQISEFYAKADAHRVVSAKKDEEISEIKGSLSGEMDAVHKELKSNEEQLSKELIKVREGSGLFILYCVLRACHGLLWSHCIV